ncbi:urease accessory protein UreE [Aestuariirhabdus sp. LZHN29]|uniref:urease accessory protein UreE n=1 Tax=Aestuariirhabdus sp. LZHN29 TaxID=3417462 RepID=UPI003CF3A7B2
MLKIVQRLQPNPLSVVGTPAAAGVKDTPSDTLSLPFELRCKGRFRARTDGGQDVGVFIERGQVLQDGELLKTECGQLIRVRSQRETLVTARCDDWLAFSKACYHLGNRHVPLQVGERWLRFQPDHVLEELVRLHGLEVITEEAPFDPENGAYGHLGGHQHQHDEPQEAQVQQAPNSHQGDNHSHHHDGHGHDHCHSHSLGQGTP